MSRFERYTIPIPMGVGAGALAAIPDELQRMGASRPLVVTDPGLVAAGLVDRLGLSDVFSDVDANPTDANVRAALEAFEGHDSVVAFGGGSAIDCAKGLRLLAGHGGRIADYDFRTGGLERIQSPMPPLLAVPTTAGTGSEVSRGALIIADGRKCFVASPRLVPSAAILDPELLTGQPPWLIAGCGMDALCHCIEELSSPREHPVAQALASSAKATIEMSLVEAFDDPSNVAAHGRLQVAAMMAGAAFEKGLGAVHSLSHAIGALHPAHHGTLNAVLLPAVLEYNGRPFPPALIRELNDRLGIPATLREMGVPDVLKTRAAELAVLDHCHATNPRPCDAHAFIEIWERSH